MDLAPLTPLPHHDDSFDHGRISGFNAWFFHRLAWLINHYTLPHKTRAFAGITAGTVVELGAGTGANTDWLRHGTRLVAVEPNRRMHDGLQATCRRAGIDLVLVGTRAEHLPLPDGCVDEVICSLALCTVGDPDAVLAEVRRVLRPGGRFRFVEHVAAPHPGVRDRVQQRIRRPWGWLFEGCDPHRDTMAHIRAAGFTAVEFGRCTLRHSVFWPVNTAVWGIATR